LKLINLWLADRQQLLRVVISRCFFRLTQPWITNPVISTKQRYEFKHWFRGALLSEVTMMSTNSVHLFTVTYFVWALRAFAHSSMLRSNNLTYGVCFTIVRVAKFIGTT